MIVGILEDPASHRGKIYPLFGPVEFTYQEIAQVLSRVLGKRRPVQAGELREIQRWPAIRGEGVRQGLYGFDGKAMHFLFQHLREVAIDHQNGIFAGTNDLVEKIGGRPPMTLEEFITKHRRAFE